MHSIVVQPIDRKCRVLGNNTVSCDQILYQDVDAWKYHKDQLDDMIQEYRKMLENLRVSLMQSFFPLILAVLFRPFVFCNVYSGS
jgi:hypothetical protein